jgi:16S rRNA (adenine1518-N6/adenine1519-N6)-dimethyltransferase
MRQLLAEREIKLTKSLGQNFLHDGNQLRRILTAAELSRSDRVLEIGPGLGPLTELLFANVAEVLAIEKDARLIEVLRERFNAEEQRFVAAQNVEALTEQYRPKKPETGATPVLRLLHDDALDWLRRNPRDWTGWKLVANLPYSVASPILVELALAPQPPDRMVVTLQSEVAQRLAARAGDKDYGVLSLLVQLRYKPHGVFRIPATCFFPPPDVDSSCIRLDRRDQELLPLELHDRFVRLVKLAFSQRRKMMMKLLKSTWPEERLRAAFSELKLSPQTRAESGTLAQFVRMTEVLSQDRE